MFYIDHHGGLVGSAHAIGVNSGGELVGMQAIVVMEKDATGKVYKFDLSEYEDRLVTFWYFVRT